MGCFPSEHSVITAKYKEALAMLRAMYSDEQLDVLNIRDIAESRRALGIVEPNVSNAFDAFDAYMATSDVLWGSDMYASLDEYWTASAEEDDARVESGEFDDIVLMRQDAMRQPQEWHDEKSEELLILQQLAQDPNGHVYGIDGMHRMTIEFIESHIRETRSPFSHLNTEEDEADMLWYSVHKHCIEWYGFAEENEVKRYLFNWANWYRSARRHRL